MHKSIYLDYSLEHVLRSFPYSCFALVLNHLCQTIIGYCQEQTLPVSVVHSKPHKNIGFFTETRQTEFDVSSNCPHYHLLTSRRRAFARDVEFCLYLRNINRDYFMVGECVRFLFTSCEGSLDERVSAANE